MTHDYKPAGIPTLMPYLTVRDAEKAIEFYQKAFGFELKEKAMGEDGKPQHIEMVFADTMIMFAPENAGGKESKSPATLNMASPISLYVYCPNVDAIYDRAVNHGARSDMEPQDTFWGDRMCRVVDLDGYAWGFATFSGVRS